MTNFTEKNRLRREAKVKNPHQYREGRAHRKLLATNGAFGHLTGESADLCRKGTSAG